MLLFIEMTYNPTFIRSQLFVVLYYCGVLVRTDAAFLADAAPSTPVPQGSQEEDQATLLAQALQQGSKPWKRSKFSLLGQGRAGKTAFANAIAGRQFEETASTVGINQLTCDVKHIQASGGAGEREQEWGECTKNLREFEAALAEILVERQRAAEGKGDSASEKGKCSGDIRAYMEAVNEVSLGSSNEEPADETVTAEEDLSQGPSEIPYTTEENAATDAMEPASPKLVQAPSAEILHPSESATEIGERQQTSASARLAPTASAKLELDEDMVMKMLATMQDAESGLLISLFDFGGQSVFEVIHHLFLTRNGVYALVFNMEWLLSDGPDKERALRFMRGWLSSIAVHTFNKTTQMTAPIVIVGTRLDTVTSPAAHERISTILHEHFSDNLAWRSVVGNEDGRDSNGRAFQWFFPVDNKLGKKGAAMKHLMSVVSGVIDKAEYTHKEVPLTWFQTIDCMADTQRDFLSLQEVMSTAGRCNVSEKEVPLLLSFLHDMGHLMWLDEPGLRDVVILDPVSYLVVPATIIICKLTPDHEDGTHHFMASHRECERMHTREWKQLKHDGMLSVKLLPILWKKYQKQSEALQMLMVKFGLLVPLRSEAFGPMMKYLVPTLLIPAAINDPDITNWTDGAFSSCYFVFTLSSALQGSSTVTEAELKSAGFLPGGMFERIVGKALSWSQDTAVGCAFDLQSALLHKDVAVLAFGRQRFRLVHCADIHCVRVDVEGAHPIGVQQKLQDFIMSIIAECMKSLLCFPAVAFQSATEDSAVTETGLCKTLQANELLIPMQQLRKASKGESMLVRKGGRALITLPEIKSKYGQWLQLYDLRERYDVFVSYRWGRYDSEFTEQLFDVFTNLSVGVQNRAVEVFLDRKRLQEGRWFTSDFAAALTHTLVAVLVVSVDALGRMVEHDPSQADNVLLEWIMILEGSAAGKIVKVFPVLFGKRLPEEVLMRNVSSAGVQVADFFADGIKDALPKIAPTATLAQAADLLRANGIEPSERMRSYTVHSVVNELLGFLLCKASDFGARQLVGGFADKVVRLLSDCGDAALDGVVTQSGENGSAGAEVAPATTVVAANAPHLAEQSLVPALAVPKGFQSLKSLTVEEVGRALAAVALDKLIPIFATNKVTGEILTTCETVSQLMSTDVGVHSRLLAKTLLGHIDEEWKIQGVSGL
jgi:GTPase SAR1 family protein